MLGDGLVVIERFDTMLVNKGVVAGEELLPLR